MARQTKSTSFSSTCTQTDEEDATTIQQLEEVTTYKAIADKAKERLEAARVEVEKMEAASAKQLLQDKLFNYVKLTIK